MIYKLLSQYIARTFIKKFLYIALITLVVIFILDTAELLRISIQHTSMDIFHILTLAVCKNYNTLQRTYPFISLLASFSTFYSFYHTNQLVAFASFGYSTLAILRSAMIGLIVFMCLHICVLSPIGAMLTKQYTSIERVVMQAKPRGSYILKDKIWITQDNVYIQYLCNQGASINSQQFSALEHKKCKNHHSAGIFSIIFNGTSISQKNNIIYDVKILLLDKNGLFNGMISASAIKEHDDNLWAISKGVYTTQEGSVFEIEDVKLHLRLSFEQMIQSIAAPEMLSIWEAHSFIANAESIGLNADRYIVYFLNLLFLPLECCMMVCFGYLVLQRGSENRGNILRDIILAVLGCLAFYIGLHGSVTVLSSHQIKPILAVFIPNIIGMCIVHLAYSYRLSTVASHMQVKLSAP